MSSGEGSDGGCRARGPAVGEQSNCQYARTPPYAIALLAVVGAFGESGHGGDAASTKIKSSHEKSERASKRLSSRAASKVLPSMQTIFYRVGSDGQCRN